jgi:hypothetical protein
MTAVYRQLDGLSLAEAAVERFRDGLRRMDADPAERERIKRLAARALRDLEDEG